MHVNRISILRLICRQIHFNMISKFFRFILIWNQTHFHWIQSIFQEYGNPTLMLEFFLIHDFTVINVWIQIEKKLFFYKYHRFNCIVVFISKRFIRRGWKPLNYCLKKVSSPNMHQLAGILIMHCFGEIKWKLKCYVESCFRNHDNIKYRSCKTGIRKKRGPGLIM